MVCLIEMNYVNLVEFKKLPMTKKYISIHTSDKIE